ncbi:MAG: hypothetical protein WCL14_07630 [Bacteroidota bacterium]
MKGAEKFYERCRKMIGLAYKKNFYRFAGADNNMLAATVGDTANFELTSFERTFIY